MLAICKVLDYFYLIIDVVADDNYKHSCIKFIIILFWLCLE